MIRHFLFAFLAVLVICATSHSDTEHDKDLNLLKDIDAEINQLTTSIGRNEIGWSQEIFTSRQTDDFEQAYLSLKGRLHPALTLIIQDVRERATKLNTTGQTLFAIPGLVSDMLTIVDYETRLNHIEFLIMSRRAMIATRLSIFIACVFGLAGLALAAFSIVTTTKLKRRFKEIGERNADLFSISRRRHKSFLHMSRRHCLRRLRRGRVFS